MHAVFDEIEEDVYDYCNDGCRTHLSDVGGCGCVKPMMCSHWRWVAFLAG